MSKPKFQISISPRNSQYYFHLRAANNEIILAGEGYQTKLGCQNGIKSVKANAIYDSQYSRLSSIDGKFYFKLKAQNNEVIGVSEMYTTAAGRENGIQAVKRDAPNAEVLDLTYHY